MQALSVTELFAMLISGEQHIAIIGLGYVGLPLALLFSEKFRVIAYDICAEKILELNASKHKQCQQSASITFTSDESQLKSASVFIVAVPTPIKPDSSPNLDCIIDATEMIQKYLKVNSLVVFESTVAPGTTDDICIPILEKSGLACGKDFKVGFSPERINPADKVHTLENIVKVVSGCDEEALDLVAAMYAQVIKAGVFRARSIKIAEACKVLENSQRDINIAFINEMCMVFQRMDIDTHDVLACAKTKWNFLDFSPGLVGGHCIAVDPYYFVSKARELGYHSQIVLAGRQINDSMTAFVANFLVKAFCNCGLKVPKSTVGVLGITFKENCDDIRNSGALYLADELRSYGLDLILCDPVANSDICHTDITVLKNLDAVIVAVAHEVFKNLSPAVFLSMFRQEASEKIFVDLKAAFPRSAFENIGVKYVRL
mmetsp:Transcript_3461/g.7029  ORF Transcript_3461/g.7029 Transcript_3461/m.7029 type:complete len:431 (+) Transcript_3461:261-1553(+)|eukprot:CAMPEP_0118800024 /NCGR_PEP_ID=MMETSP1161-20130426/2062_1 /TAXON_ID=249345 /ORGANISM="Picochlorum oklahomensis, Strain CCMP2329" /LENGTH=430 /DNA_ID=CAMNT_0006727803 /DNA_START=280 /DNA_END=1572 /DNA_ORIENTATION=-